MTRRRLTAVALAVAATAVVLEVAIGEGSGGYGEVSLLEGFREPAAVAVLDDGTVVVADFSDDAVTALEPDGSPLWRAESGLDHPSGLGVQGQRLWVADTGNGRILELDTTDGTVLAEWALPEGLRPTDVQPVAGGALWVSATPDDRLVKLSATGQVELDLRSVGAEPLRAPRGLAGDGDGGVFVAEALGGRVLHVGEDGALVAALGQWGLGEGQFIKPKDVLVDGDQLLVLDSHQAIIQRLDHQGHFLGLLATSTGPLTLTHPLGLAGSRDRLIVADAGANAIRTFEPQGDLWNDGHFPEANTLFRHTSIRDDDPDALCRQCHDGTRRLTAGNWDPAAHNHPREVPEDDRGVPDEVRRTSDGRLMCTSCHPVHHIEPGPEGVHSDIVDIGLADEAPVDVHAPGFCLTCHVDYLDTSAARHRKSHPVGVAPPVGADLAALGIDATADPVLSCRTCHQPHGATFDHLLVRDATDGTLCLSCHVDHDATTSVHPVLMSVDRDIQATIGAMGGVVGSRGQLTCLSCHDPHKSTSGTLLRAAGRSADACRLCHEDTSHTVAVGGHGAVGCTSCHGMHSAPSLPAGQAPPGVGPDICVSCHTSDRGSGPQISATASHPVGVPAGADHGGHPLSNGLIGCTSCHQVHGPDDRLVRRADIGALCVDCHPGQGSVVGTDHDASIVGVAGSRDTCLSCHDVHGSDAPYLAAPRPGDNPSNGRCLSCHDGSTSATDPGATGHPAGLLLTSAGLPFRYDGPVPYFGPDGEPSTRRDVGEITCATCHDPHLWKHGEIQRPGAADGSEQNSFLRDPTEIARFCSVCHGVDGLARFGFFHTDRHREEVMP